MRDPILGERLSRYRVARPRRGFAASAWRFRYAPFEVTLFERDGRMGKMLVSFAAETKRA